MIKLTKRIIKSSERDIKLPARSRILLLDYIKTTTTKSGAVKSVKSAAVKNRRIIIGANSQVQYVVISDDSSRAEITRQRELHIGANCQVDIFSAYFGQGDSQIKINNYLDKQSVVNSRVLFWLKREQVLQVQDNYIFTAPATVGKFKIEGLIDDAASAQYYSDVVIEPAAQGTDSRIDMRLHLLSPTAKGNLLPGLKIAANQVKAGHGASTFRLAPEDVFYLQARGLSPEQIKILVINSVASQFTGAIKDGTVKNLLLKLIKQRAI